MSGSGGVGKSFLQVWQLLTISSVAMDSPGHQIALRTLAQHLAILRWPIWMSANMLSLMDVGMAVHWLYTSRPSTTTIDGPGSLNLVGGWEIVYVNGSSLAATLYHLSALFISLLC